MKRGYKHDLLDKNHNFRKKPQNVKAELITRRRAYATLALKRFLTFELMELKILSNHRVQITCDSVSFHLEFYQCGFSMEFFDLLGLLLFFGQK